MRTRFRSRLASIGAACMLALVSVLTVLPGTALMVALPSGAAVTVPVGSAIVPPVAQDPNGYDVPVSGNAIDVTYDKTNMPLANRFDWVQEYSYDGGATWREAQTGTVVGGSFTTRNGSQSFVMTSTLSIPANPRPNRTRIRTLNSNGNSPLVITISTH